MWWKKPTYTTTKIPNSDDVVIIPKDEKLECIQGINPRKFIIDQSIAKSLINLK